MNNEEKILQMLAELQQGQKEINARLGATNTRLDATNAQLDATNTRLDATNVRLDAVVEQQKIHNESILQLENKVMHELKVLNELLPDALAKREAFEAVAAKVDDHGHRIFALEQKAVNG